MLPEITYKQIRNVEFPIFALPKGEMYYQDGLLTMNGRVIDDKNMPGETLGMRRLQTPHRRKKLSKAVYSLESLLSSRLLNFIDNKGRIFRYSKTKYLDLKYHKIQKIDLRDSYCILHLAGVKVSFMQPRPPQAGEQWAGVLYISHQHPWSIYNLSTDYIPPSRKKV